MSCRKTFSHLLNPSELKTLARSWLAEDVTGFDFGGFVVGDSEENGVISCKSSGILAGIPFCSAIFEELNCDVTWHFDEGFELTGKGEKVATIKGAARNLLLAERVVLNCLSRASGIASKSAFFKRKAIELGWKGDIVGTRKTTPGFRLVEKYALLVGGAGTHRYNLSDLTMLKDNHIWTLGSVTKAVERAKIPVGFTRKVEVECRTLEDSLEALKAGADIVMLDNMKGQVFTKKIYVNGNL